MSIVKFFQRFPTEEKCKQHFLENRIKQGVVCKKCEGKKHYWMKTIEQFKCANCGFRTTLKSGTTLHGTHLPYQYWYIAFYIVTETKKPISAVELQALLGHRYYEPIWYLMHRIRTCMGKRDEQYKLQGRVEMDDAFIKATKEKDKDATEPKEPVKKKRGRGTEKKPFVVLVESQQVSGKKQSKFKPDKAVSFIKMLAVDYLNSKTITSNLQKNTQANAHIVSDKATYYQGVENFVEKHTVHNLSTNPAALDDEFFWIHKVISNFKRNILGIHHSIGEKYLQNYLNEFCYRFNRRHFVEPFDTLLRMASQTSHC